MGSFFNLDRYVLCSYRLKVEGVIAMLENHNSYAGDIWSSYNGSYTSH